MLFTLFLSAIKLAVSAVLCLLAVFLVWLVRTVLIAPLCDPLRNLPGPEGSMFTSHLNQVSDPDISPIIHKDWTTNFGKTFRFQGFGKYDYRLMSFDLRVISHVLNSPVYEKPWQARSLLGKFLGRGVFTAEGVEHALQRKIIGPAFTASAIKGLTPIFFQKAEELCDQWVELISQGSGPSGLIPGCITLDANDWFARATFDVFGLAAFDYHFRALSDEDEQLYTAFRRMFGVVDQKSILHILFPNLENYWPDETTKTTRECLEIIRKAGAELIATKKAVILSEKADIDKKDLLSLLIKSNLSTEPGRRLSDGDLLDQVSSFLFVGTDSTALTTTWCFHFLSLNPDIQSRLRSEIFSIPVSLSSIQGQDAIMALPYLDAVVRETLRLCPPTHATLRAAMADDIIPVSHPVILKTGRILGNGEYIQIRKGSYVHIPIEGLNYDEDIWGRDSKKFNPDRWFSLPPNARPPAYPGIANVMTFSFGPHSCPGHKFSISEIKAFVATLLLRFTFKAVEGQTVLKMNGILTRPLVKGQSGLPMIIGLHRH